MKETCCRLGEHGELAGIVTEPEGVARAAFILVSAGLLAKPGPYRLYVELARRLAREGFVTLRFDLGGLGDSPQRDAGYPLRVRTELEIRDAVDHLARHHGVTEVTLGGLCSGAEDAFRYAEQDPRVKSVVMIDPFGHRTAGWAWRHALHRLMRRSLRAAGVYRPAHRATSGAGATAGKRLVTYKYMERDESRRILETMLARSAAVHFIYTGGMIESFNHAAQLQGMFPDVDFRDLVTLDHFPHMEHTQALAEDRRELVEAVCARLRVDQERLSTNATAARSWPPAGPPREYAGRDVLNSRS